MVLYLWFLVQIIYFRSQTICAGPPFEFRSADCLVPWNDLPDFDDPAHLPHNRSPKGDQVQAALPFRTGIAGLVRLFAQMVVMVGTGQEQLPAEPPACLKP